MKVKFQKSPNCSFMTVDVMGSFLCENADELLRTINCQTLIPYYMVELDGNRGQVWYNITGYRSAKELIDEGKTTETEVSHRITQALSYLSGDLKINKRNILVEPDMDTVYFDRAGNIKLVYLPPTDKESADPDAYDAQKPEKKTRKIDADALIKAICEAQRYRDKNHDIPLRSYDVINIIENMI